jgi:hypothetical protein
MVLRESAAGSDSATHLDDLVASAGCDQCVVVAGLIRGRISLTVARMAFAAGDRQSESRIVGQEFVYGSRHSIVNNVAAVQKYRFAD